MDITSITIHLTEEQAQDLRQIRESFSSYRLGNILNELFTNALVGYGRDRDAEDMTADHFALSKIHLLVQIMMQPGIQGL